VNTRSPEDLTLKLTHSKLEVLTEERREGHFGDREQFRQNLESGESPKTMRA
jgi:hypothetical protein